jgi:F-type H+-transporting ATPase subunit b
MRRIRLLLAAAATLFAVFALSSPASAQEAEGEHDVVEDVIHEAEEKGATHSDAECIEILAEGGSIDECRAAPSPILPELNEIIWGTFGFLIVFGGLAWKGYPAIKKTMNDRTEKIRADIEGAEAAKAEADGVLSQYNAQLADAKSESARIVEEARQEADRVRAERIAAIEPELAELRARAEADAAATRTQAMADLRGEVTALALGAAEKVIERNLDDATNRALIDSYIESVGASR